VFVIIIAWPGPAWLAPPPRPRLELPPLHDGRGDEAAVHLARRRPRLAVDLRAVPPEVRAERRRERAPATRLRGGAVDQRVPRDGARRVEETAAFRALVARRAVDRPVPRQTVRTWNRG
jgi:hypothetical protein